MIEQAPLVPKMVVGAGAIVASAEAFQSGGEAIVLSAAVIAALGYIWVKVVRPLIRFSRRVGRGVDLLEELPHFRQEVRSRFEVIEGALYGTDRIERLPIGRRDDPPHR